MKLTHALVGLAIFAGLAAAGVSVAANLTSSHHSDFYSPGKHQFYVWCADGSNHTAYQDGASAEDAQMKLYRTGTQSKCWPVWQGRVSS